MRNSFLLHVDSLDVLEHLDDEQAGRLFRAAVAYHKGEDVDLDAMLKLAFVPIKNSMDRDREKYERIVERNKVNGSKGGRPKEPKKPSGKTGNPKEPKKADNVNDSDNGNGSDKPRRRFIKPTPEQAEQYAREIGWPDLSGQAFCDHYETRGWKLSSGVKMSDWKACIRTWKQRRESQSQSRGRGEFAGENYGKTGDKF